MNETQYIQKRLRPFLKDCGFAVVHKSSERFSSGWPDLTCIHAPDGETVYIETKVDGGDLTPLQFKTLVDLARSGARAFIFRWLNDEKRQQIYHITISGCKNYWTDNCFTDTFRKEDA